MFLVLTIIIIGLIWNIRLKTNSIDELNTDLAALNVRYEWVTNALDTAILFIEDQHIVWMNEAGQQIFGPEVPKPFEEIIYNKSEGSFSHHQTTIQCQCLGLYGYLFPARLQIKRASSTSIEMILVEDLTFQAQSTLPSKVHSPSPKITAASSTDQTHIVVVDDDESVLETYSEMLEIEGWKVTSFSTADSALDFIGSNCQSISLIITDYQLREMTGFELLNRSQSKALDIKGMVISGFNLNEPIQPDVPFLQKPCTRQVLVKTVESLLKNEKR